MNAVLSIGPYDAEQAAGVEFAQVYRCFVPVQETQTKCRREDGDVQVLKDRAREDVGRKHASRDATLERLKTVCDGEALTRLRVPASAGTRGADKFVWTPHLMLYVLHDDTGGVKRLLLSSANLSMAAWGYRRSGRFPDDENAIPTDDGALEVRSLELGVCMPPGDPD